VTLDEKKAFARLYLNAALGLALSTIQRKEHDRENPKMVSVPESQTDAAEPGA
jgi:hypothetical protein